ncbi:unnamed protein product [Rotaria sp. Silwood2]|nr:unnamed protein product [Rotaria sp. Silwood2]CAF2968854.1 unnamed protein product [Rotaria sp. Silwood2]CAF3327228.1 unnamed protein product [Rotaria sp. Silwood2]CAF4028450.1 unnamed protein product [Rotaria sp. Silwood2]CAF4057972.1 unnamed protein product [Rotaria sp. Silwood2]
MYSKQYLLVTILFAVVILSTSIDQTQENSDAGLNVKKGAAYQGKIYEVDDEMDDQPSGAQSNANVRQPSYSPPEAYYRFRSRWPPAAVPSLHEYYKNQMDMSRFINRNMMPVPLGSYNNNPMFSMGTSCHSLIDPKYPIFSDMCGAVPQARYGLPNTFGHYDRWQLAHILTTIMGSTTDPNCIRSLRHLLCPMLFQPCRARHEPPLVLPCQFYCRAVKSQCAVPALDVIPCDTLPYASDICPNIQSYGPFMPAGISPAPTQPSTQDTVPSTDQQTARSFASQSVKQGPPSTVNSPPSPSTVSSMQSQSPANIYNRRPYGNEGYVDVPFRSYANDYRQPPRYAPLTQSTFKTRPTVDVYPSNEARQASGQVQPVPRA